VAQANNQGQWAPPTNAYPHMAPPQQGQWSVHYQMPPAQQQWGTPPTSYPSVPPGASPLAGQYVRGPAQLEYTIPLRYNGDVVDKYGTKVYHLTTTSASSTVLSDHSGATIGHIDWGHHKESRTKIAIRHNKWHRDELLHPNADKSFTFRVNKNAGGYTWKGFQNGIQCFSPSGSKVAEFPYRAASMITLDPAHPELVELVIVTALLIHHEQSRHSKHGVAFGEHIAEGFSDAAAGAVVGGFV